MKKNHTAAVAAEVVNATSDAQFGQDFLDVMKELGGEVGSWEINEGKEQRLFRDGPGYRLVTESVQIRDSDGWRDAKDYFAEHPGKYLHELPNHWVRFAYTAQQISPAEAAHWFRETVISGLVPEELHSLFGMVAMEGGVR